MAGAPFDPDRFAGRVAFISGVARGQGRQFAVDLAEEGADIIGFDICEDIPGASTPMATKADLEETRTAVESTGRRMVAEQADVRDYAAVERAVAATLERFGRIDIAVNGAAGNFLCKAEELSPNGFGTVVDIDLKGTFNVCRAAFGELKKRGGQILNISATLHYLGTPMQLHVSAAKAGVDALTRNLAAEWGRYGIRTNAVAPGPIEDTEGMKRLLPEPLKEKLRRQIPLGRFGLIKDIAQTSVFLCSDAAGYVNGAVVVVDGGHWLASNRLLGGE